MCALFKPHKHILVSSKRCASDLTASSTGLFTCPLSPFSITSLTAYPHKLFSITYWDSTHPAPDAVCNSKRVPLLTLPEFVSAYCDPLFPATLPTSNQAHTSCCVVKDCLTCDRFFFQLLKQKSLKQYISCVQRGY